MFDGIDEVVLPAADIAALEHLYRELLGFEIVRRGGPLDAGWARIWSLPSPPRREVLLGKAGAAGGAIRLVEVPDLPPATPAGPPDRLGPYALDFFLRDAARTEERLVAAGVEYRTPAAHYLLPGTDIPVRERIFDQRISGLIHATIAHRPRGTRCVLDAEPGHQVSEVVALVAVTDDPTGAADFATGVLGAQRYFAGEFGGEQLERMLYLDSGDALPLQLFRGAGSRNARLEFATKRTSATNGNRPADPTLRDRPADPKLRDRPADPTPRAVATCRVDDLDRIAARLVDGRHGESTGVTQIRQDGRPTRRLGLRSRYGLTFDLVERPTG